MEKFGFRDLFCREGKWSSSWRKSSPYRRLLWPCPHQDYWSVQGSLDGVVVWMPLVDVDKENFPLEVIPQSHLKAFCHLVIHVSISGNQGDQFQEIDFSGRSKGVMSYS
ncbi:phytanoyl-CoA dioxygenase family protein [Rhodoferax sp. AJA081-3]|nr:phytanoyl-CoA dioxygenase family protein [Rhodoferax sp. AJA081-3]